MNLVGKILIVLNLVAAIAFMTFAAVVHSTHVNWRDEVVRTEAVAGKAIGLTKQIEQKNATIADLQGQLTQMLNDAQRLEREYDQRLGQLSTRLAEIQAERDAFQADLAAAVEIRKTQEGQLNAATDMLAKNETEISALRDINTKLIQDRDKSFTRVRELESEIAQQKGEYERLVEQNNSLKVRIGQYLVAFQDLEMQLDRSGPPRLEGVIEAATEEGLVQISLGFDDGLEKGHIIDAFRLGQTLDSTQYLGQLRIVRTEKDKSVGQIIPETMKGKVQRDDRVATRLSGLE